ncbi:spherical body protein, putative [Babesia ovata]|uniref:Spherical body protein, putative n=1 Tax=Babesia ovata TaxID=189622 RepID=A0A2H6KCF1_9APIC|nr:spherical body protein, putative [Babesia ovata]GBE60676.1 spherical body protein, putative [Babesia ovata]
MTNNHNGSSRMGVAAEHCGLDTIGMGLLHLPQTNAELPFEVNLESFQFPAGVEVFKGTFPDGGVYRLVRGEAGTIRVLYGNVELVPRIFEAHAHNDVYVEYFVRGEERVIRLFAFSNYHGHPAGYRIKTFLVDHSGPVECSDHAVSCFVCGPISLELNITPNTPMHPFVERKVLLDNGLFGYAYTLARKHRGYEVHPSRNYFKHPYMIGSIYYTLFTDEGVVPGTQPLEADSYIVRALFSDDHIQVHVLKPRSVKTYTIHPVRSAH